MTDAPPQSGKPLRQPSPEAIKLAAALLLRRHQRLNPPPRTDSANCLRRKGTNISAIPQAIDSPDAWLLGAKTPRGQDIVGSLKRLPDGTVLYLEEVRSGRKTLAMTSVRKYPGTTDFETIKNRIVPSYAQSDTGAIHIVYPQGHEGQDTANVAHFGMADAGALKANARNVASNETAQQAIDRAMLAFSRGAAGSSRSPYLVKLSAGWGSMPRLRCAQTCRRLPTATRNTTVPPPMCSATLSS